MIIPINKCQDIAAEKNIGIIGYGPQGRGQSLNLRDNKINVCLGLRKGPNLELALEDGWVEGKICLKWKKHVNEEILSIFTF